MTTGCPTEPALYEYAHDPAHARDRLHIAGCERCGHALVEIQEALAEFRTQVFPLTKASVVHRAEVKARRRSLWLWLSPAPFLAAAAAMLLVHANRPADEYVGQRGAPLSFTVLRASGSQLVPLESGETIPANAELRFQVRTATPCALTVLSLDSTGQVSRLFPAEGVSAPVKDASLLPGGAAFDGVPGPERVFAFCAAQAGQLNQAEAMLTSLGSGAATVRQADVLKQLAPGIAGATVLLEKK
jgi:hypothetical protein